MADGAPRRLSAQGRRLLDALANAEDGTLALCACVILEERAGASRTVARASVSRTLRRLWRQKLIELYDGAYGARASMTAKQQAAIGRRDRALADPEGTYAAFRAWLLGVAALSRGGARDRYGSAAALVAATVAAANRTPKMRVARVELTAAGRERLLSSSEKVTAAEQAA
jgi:hypothetical protein